MSVIYCDVNMFDNIQHIHIVDNQGNNTIVNCVQPFLGNQIAELCYQQNINNIHLFGNQKYLQGIITDINYAYKLKYSNQDLNIEVN